MVEQLLSQDDAQHALWISGDEKKVTMIVPHAFTFV